MFANTCAEHTSPIDNFEETAASYNSLADVKSVVTLEDFNKEMWDAGTFIDRTIVDAVHTYTNTFIAGV